jgi:hypothetical protein
LAIKACQAGHRVAFQTAQQWIDRLEQAQHRNALDSELRRLERYSLLVVDEIGYLPLERQAANLLFALVARRYERGSIIVTSNRGFEAWGEILGDAMVAAALIDRLIHHAHMVTLKGKSYRLRERGTVFAFWNIAHNVGGGITGLIAKEDSKIAGAIVESVMKYEARRLEAKTISPSIYEQKDWAMKYLASLRDTLAMTHRIVKGDPVLSKPETGAIALALILGGYTAANVEAYLGDVLQSVGRYPDSPAVDLHRQLLKSKERSAAKGKLSKEEKMALAFKGAGLYAEKLSTGGLRWKVGKEPLPAPVPPTSVAKAA